MKRFIYIVLMIAGLVLILSLILMIPPVGEKVAKTLNVASDKFKMVVRTIAGIALGVLLVGWGIAALTGMPVLGAVMIIGGLGMLAWNLWPLFSSSTDLGK